MFLKLLIISCCLLCSLSNSEELSNVDNSFESNIRQKQSQNTPRLHSTTPTYSFREYLQRRRAQNESLPVVPISLRFLRLVRTYAASRFLATSGNDNGNAIVELLADSLASVAQEAGRLGFDARFEYSTISNNEQKPLQSQNKLDPYSPLFRTFLSRLQSNNPTADGSSIPVPENPPLLDSFLQHFERQKAQNNSLQEFPFGLELSIEDGPSYSVTIRFFASSSNNNGKSIVELLSNFSRSVVKEADRLDYVEQRIEINEDNYHTSLYRRFMSRFLTTKPTHSFREYLDRRRAQNEKLPVVGPCLEFWIRQGLNIEINFSDISGNDDCNLVVELLGDSLAVVAQEAGRLGFDATFEYTPIANNEQKPAQSQNKLELYSPLFRTFLSRLQYSNTTADGSSMPVPQIKSMQEVPFSLRFSIHDDPFFIKISIDESSGNDDWNSIVELLADSFAFAYREAERLGFNVTYATTYALSVALSAQCLKTAAG